MFGRRRKVDVIPPGRVIRRATVRLVDLVPPFGTPPLIDEAVFEDCLIIGPTVMMIMGACQFDRCTFNYDGRGSIESVLWPLPNDEWAVGCVGVRACLFERCEFRGLGYAGGHETLEMVRRAVTPTTE